MKPVFPNETRRERALFAARLHTRTGTELSAEAMKLICEDYLCLAGDELVTLSMERVHAVVARLPDPPSDIEPGRPCKHDVPYARPCAECGKSGVPYAPKAGGG